MCRCHSLATGLALSSSYSSKIQKKNTTLNTDAACGNESRERERKSTQTRTSEANHTQLVIIIPRTLFGNNHFALSRARALIYFFYALHYVPGGSFDIYARVRAASSLPLSRRGDIYIALSFSHARSESQLAAASMHRGPVLFYAC